MLRTYEAAVSVTVLLFGLVQFVALSAGRLGEQWDSTDLDVEVKRALEGFQVEDITSSLEKYSKIRDLDLLRLPDVEGIGYRLLINGEPIDTTMPPVGGEVVTTDAKVCYGSRDAARLVPSLRRRLLRSDYVNMAGLAMDYESVDELAEVILGMMWDPDSEDIIENRVETLVANQNEDGGWGFVRGEESDTLCTSAAVRAIAAWIRREGGSPLSSPVVADGVKWLKDRVHADGGYGSRERMDSSTDMTALAILAYAEAGLGEADAWVNEAVDFLLRLQLSDGGFANNRGGSSQPGTTAIVMEALMAWGAPDAAVGRASDYLRDHMVSDGDFTMVTKAMNGAGTYDLRVESGYLIDCSPRGYEFWGNSWDDSIIAIMDVSGDRDNLTIKLRIERERLVPPANKQKIALCFSKNMTPDDTDWWILNAGNPHTSGQGVKIDDPKFDTEVVGAYTYLTVTNLTVPAEYDFFSPTEDWILAIVGESTHPIQDNPGKGYLIGYWNPWMKAFPFNNVLAWSAMGSPRINRVCLDLDGDAEFDDKRLTGGDTVSVDGRNWELSIASNETAVNLSFNQDGMNITRFYYPCKYDIPSDIPESASDLYHFGVVSVYNKPSFSRSYKVILRDSRVPGVYDEAYIFNGTDWNLYPDGSTWNESGTLWILEIEEDFLRLTGTDATTLAGLSGGSSASLSLEGDFIKVSLDSHGPSKISLIAGQGSRPIGSFLFEAFSDRSSMIVFGTWGGLRETSRAYSALSQAETWLTGARASMAHDAADLCQQAIKFSKTFNSVIEDRLDLQAWYMYQGMNG